MLDLDQSYDVMGPDGTKIGEIVKRQYYDINGHPSEGVISEAGLVDDKGKVIASWDGDSLARADGRATFELKTKG